MLLAARDIYGGMKWIQDEQNRRRDQQKHGEGESRLRRHRNPGQNDRRHRPRGRRRARRARRRRPGHESRRDRRFARSHRKEQASVSQRHHLGRRPIDELYQAADYISLNVPLIPQTKGMINKNSIAKMKDGVVILNIAQRRDRQRRRHQRSVAFQESP
ncbi:MAG: hypothetical protein MZU97_26635 [Bacillus subtilis]|nr:hypothetical protein [Bacillus subtilis]